MGDPIRAMRRDQKRRQQSNAAKSADKTGYARGVKVASNAIPTNWTDSLLTGDEGIGAPPYDCRHIEKLLRGVQDRVRALMIKP